MYILLCGELLTQTLFRTLLCRLRTVYIYLFGTLHRICEYLHKVGHYLKKSVRNYGVLPLSVNAEFHLACRKTAYHSLMTGEHAPHTVG